MEPQRRFQDGKWLVQCFHHPSLILTLSSRRFTHGCVPADTIGKQDAFDWGNGWAAVRAISWSPFDDFIFASTGNVRAIIALAMLGLFRLS